MLAKTIAAQLDDAEGTRIGLFDAAKVAALNMKAICTELFLTSKLLPLRCTKALWSLEC